MKGMFVGLTAMVLAAGAMADGNTFLVQCQSAVRFIDTMDEQSPGFAAGMCMGTVEGVAGAIDLVNGGLSQKFKVCPPVGVTNSQAVRVVVKYMQENPKDLHLRESQLTYLALRQAYPCR